MKKKELRYPPLQLADTLSNRYPEVWEKMEDFHDHNGAGGLPSWKEWCYAPMAASIAIVSGGLDVRLNMMADAQAIAAVAPWRISKQVYRLDPELERTLADQDDMTVPGEILLSLPFLSFYVEVSTDVLDLPDLHGFFVHLEDDVNTHQAELRILYVDKKGQVMFGQPIYIDAGTIQESLKRVNETSRINAVMADIDPSIVQTHPQLKDMLKKSLQIILYLCSDNKEIIKRERKEKVQGQQVSAGKRQKDVKDRYQELEPWDVGIRIGTAIKRARMQYETSAPSANGTHASPRPHMRRGHWHHFWTGKRDDEAARKLILRWVPPTAVNAGLDADELPVRIQNVQ